MKGIKVRDDATVLEEEESQASDAEDIERCNSSSKRGQKEVFNS
jgi:hypothetical protein